MNIVLGGTGHVGSATAAALLKRGEPVTIVTRGSAKSDEWERKGALIAVADASDVESLRRVFRQGKRLFLVNPPADPATDTDAEERRTAGAIVAALSGSGVEKIVVQSTYGAQAGERCGDLSTLYALERMVQAQAIPATILRAAYYMSNWDSSLITAQESGVVQSFLPETLELPMVAPHDVGEVAARWLLEDARTGLYHVEGPERYTPGDVSRAFAAALDKPVRLDVTPRDHWRQAFQSLGFSESSAESYARMTAVTVDEPYELPDEPERGNTSLRRYIAELVERASTA